uniref:Gag-pol polyprotein n=1 Tax=Solanum tuberosum TaxID=4113 RepID=M1DH67_SOLTU
MLSLESEEEEEEKSQPRSSQGSNVSSLEGFVIKGPVVLTSIPVGRILVEQASEDLDMTTRRANARRNEKDYVEQEVPQAPIDPVGFLNGMSEANLESITSEISMIYQIVGRTFGSQIINEEVLASCFGGPRGNEQ